ncbi:hypothetical protein TNCV_3922831 [Trichonephila clavipes]|nr:hypothetical protein TNCV_3922831 [Trichonephila clavipes]
MKTVIQEDMTGPLVTNSFPKINDFLRLECEDRHHAQKQNTASQSLSIDLERANLEKPEQRLGTWQLGKTIFQAFLPKKKELSRLPCLL